MEELKSRIQKRNLEYAREHGKQEETKKGETTGRKENRKPKETKTENTRNRYTEKRKKGKTGWEDGRGFGLQKVDEMRGKRQGLCAQSTKN